MAEIRRLHPEDEKSFRLAPHNVEAEQALLGAILVNNEAFYRVSDFLAPEHFYEPIHREIYEVTAKIIRAGKTATPVTVKTFLPDNLIADVTMPQYLARLASEATTVINAADYGQSIYDLAIRRNLIQIGEEMVSTAYDADVEQTAPKQIEEAEKALFDLPNAAAMMAASSPSPPPSRTPSRWRARPMDAMGRSRAPRPVSPISTG